MRLRVDAALPGDPASRLRTLRDDGVGQAADRDVAEAIRPAVSVVARTHGGTPPEDAAGAEAD